MSNFSPPKNSLFGNAYSFFFSGTCSGKAVNERTYMQTTMAKPKWMLTIDDVIIYGIGFIRRNNHDNLHF